MLDQSLVSKEFLSSTLSIRKLQNYCFSEYFRKSNNLLDIMAVQGHSKTQQALKKRRVFEVLRPRKMDKVELRSAVESREEFV